MIRRLRPSTSSLDLETLFGKKPSKAEQKRRRRQRRRNLQVENLEERALLAGFELLSIQPNAQEILNQGDVRNIGFNELTFRFTEGTDVDIDSLPGGLTFQRTGFDGIFGNGNDVVITPNFYGFGESTSEVIVRFAETLPDDLYQIQFFGAGPTPLMDTSGATFDAVSITPAIDNLTRNFELNLGAQVIAVVPQPIVRDTNGVLTQAKNQIIVYFNDDDLLDGITSAENPAFYQLILTRDTVRNTDNLVYNPTSVAYDPATDRAVLTFATDLDLLTDPLAGGSDRTYRLRIGTDEVFPGAPNPPTQVDGSAFDNLDQAGSSFTAAFTVGALGAQSVLLDSSIDARLFPLEYPGANDEPGHREVPIESHLLGSADNTPGVETFEYNFAPTIVDPDDSTNVLQNLINEEQKQRAREIFEIYSHYLGVQFIETATRGFTIATGDMRYVDPTIPTGPGDGTLGVAGPVGMAGTQFVAVMDGAEAWDDGFGFANAAGKESWFTTAMHEIGHLLGLGHSYELPPGTIMGEEGILAFTNQTEPVFPGDADIVHGQHLHRTESNDIDMYQFTIGQTGLFSAETFAERLANSSLLDTNLILFDAAGNVITRNNDYFSEDSYLEFELGPGTYYIGVSSTGNEEYDPDVADSGFGGTSQGVYQLRLNFRPDVNNSIVDLGGTLNPGDPEAVPTALDGDADGVPGGVYNFWFRTQNDAHTFFVDKAFTGTSTGAINAPFKNISNALAAASTQTAIDGQGVIVRIVGNTQGLSYQIGRNGATTLVDGAALEVPKNVTVMVDAGAIFKMLESRVGVGSSSANVDRSKGAFQVLGTPDSSVFFTSFNDDSIGGATNPLEDPDPGDWGGLRFRNDFDNTANRFSYEDQGIFLNYVNHADLRYGGGDVPIGSVRPIVAPISMVEARPTVTFNTITLSADAAMGADPNSFKESNFHTPRDQQAGLFTADYSRVGPDIHGNWIVGNSINGLYVRIATPAGNLVRTLTVSGHFDDTDIVHVINENLVISGTPGGPIFDEVVPPVTLVVLTASPGGGLTAGTYNYRITFVDALGNETPASAPTGGRTVNTGDRITLTNLPTASGQFVARRIYRSDSAGGGVYRLVAQIQANGTTFVDNGGPLGGELEDPPFSNLRARQDASLVIDPGTIVKLGNSRIEVGIGANLIAEGLLGREVVFTSLQDDSYGAGGTSDTRSDGVLSTPAPADWGGIHARQASSLSVDHGVFAYGGGITSIGGTAAGFNVIEVHQATARITHSTFYENASGLGGQAGPGRVGRGFNDAAVIFVRGAQPVIADNLIRDNAGAAISINVNALNSEFVRDLGRQTGAVDTIDGSFDNQGALVDGNVLGNNDINGMRVRAQTLTTESVWDDTDIVHVVDGMIYVPDFHTYGGLRLESRSNESLVVKFTDASAGLTATGRPLDIDDRIGGGLQVVGQPGRPVVLTSILDDTVGAGFDPQGNPQLDTNNDGLPGDDDDGFLQLPSPGIPFTVTPSLLGQDLLDAMLLRPLAPGVTITGANLISAGNAAGVYNGGDSVPLQIPLSGAILTSGDALLPTSNTTSGFTGIAGTPPDADLDALIAPTGFTTTEATSLTLTIDVAPGSGIQSGSFLFQFGSDEYSEFVNSLFNDVLGGFVNGGAATNFLRDSVGNLISINSALFDIDNESTPTLNIEYDGMTIGLLAEFPLVEGANTVKIAIGDVSDTILDSGILMTDLQFSTRNVGTGGVTGAAPASPGDWAGVIIDQFAGDRNVDVAVESELLTVDAPGTNSTPDEAQFIGAIAPAEYEGDENLRLGFDVHGYLNGENDVDVYSFDADVGTEVWFDIDHTSSSLDTIIEVLDGDGNVVATSNDSELLDHTIQLAGTDVNGLGKSDFYRIDTVTLNPRDAGMRVVLPGAVGDTDTFYVRVKSDGNTEGGYKLQLRLRETQEVPGSGVRYADVRFAATGIQVLGHPLHSPLLGEAADVEGNGGANDFINNAQALGNIINSDRGAVNIAGAFSNWQDVDFYEFNVQYDSTQGTSASPLSTIFDVDYASGAAGPDTTLAIYDSLGRLIFVATDSNVADDLAGPFEGADIDDLLRGSVNNGDPLLGAVNLPAGQYFLAISNSTSRIQQLEQFLNFDPINELLRLAPIGSTNRVVEDTISDNPALQVFLTDEGVVPFNLGDVTLFVSQDLTGAHNTRLLTVDPFTGRLETVVVNSFNRNVGDIEIRNDGTLVSFTHGTPDPANPDFDDLRTGHYITIDTGDGTIGLINDDGITTWFRTGTAPNFTPARADVGILFDAMAFLEQSGITSELYAVGRRRDAALSPTGVSSLQNILYVFDPATGLATSLPAQDRGTTNQPPLYDGAGTQIRERGVIITNGSQVTVPEVTSQNPNSSPQNFNDPFDTLSTILDGLQFTFTNTAGTSIIYELDLGPTAIIGVDPSLSAEDGFGQRYLLDGDFFYLEGDILQYDLGWVVDVERFLPFLNAPASEVADGDTLIITGLGQVALEFDTAASPGTIDPTRPVPTILIPFTPGVSTKQDIVNLIINTVNGLTGFGVTASQLPGTGRITFSNANNVVVAPQSQGGLFLASAGGAAPIISAPSGNFSVADGQGFTLNDGATGVDANFEFDTNGIVTDGVEQQLVLVDGGALDEQQTLRIIGGANPNTFQIRLSLAGISQPITTGNLAFNATAAAVQTAIDNAILSSGLVPNYMAGDLAVSGGTVNTAPGLTFDYTISLGAANHGDITVVNAGGAQVPVFNTVQHGRAGIVPEVQDFVITGGSGTLNEVQTVAINGGVSTGNEHQTLQIAPGVGTANEVQTFSIGNGASQANERQTLQITGGDTANTGLDDNEQQFFSIGGSPTGGTVNLIFNFADGSTRTVAGLPFNANDAFVQGAINAQMTGFVPGYAANDLRVTGDQLNTTGLTFDFEGSLGNQNHPQLTFTQAVTGSPIFNPGTLGNGSGDSFTLTLDLAGGLVVTTPAIPFSATAAMVQDFVDRAILASALVPGYAAGDLSVSGVDVANQLTFDYLGSLQGQDHGLLSVDTTGFVFGTPTVNIPPAAIEGAGDTFTLTLNLFGGQAVTTSSLPFNATRVQVQTAIDAALAGAVQGYTAGDVAVTGTNVPNSLTLTFGGSLAGQNHAPLTLNPTFVGTPIPSIVQGAQGAGDTFTLTLNLFGGSAITTLPIAFNAAASQVQTRIDAAILASGLVPGYAAGQLLVGGTNILTGLTFDYTGVLGGQNHNPITVDVTGYATAPAVTNPPTQTDGGGDTFTLTVNLAGGASVTTLPLAFNATGVQVQQAVNTAIVNSGLVPGYTANDVLVTGTTIQGPGPGPGLTFTFQGSLANQDQPAITLDTTGFAIAPGVSILETNGAGDTFTLTLNLFGGAMITTAPIPYNASSGQVQAALEDAIILSGLVPGYAPGDIQVTGTNVPTTLTVIYGGSLAGVDHALLTIDTAGFAIAPTLSQVSPGQDGTSNTIDLTFHLFDTTSITVSGIAADALWTDVQTAIDDALVAANLTGLVPGYMPGDVVVGRGRIHTGVTLDYGGVSLSNQNHGEATVTTNFQVGTPGVGPFVTTILNATTAIRSGVGFENEAVFASTILSAINRTANANRDFSVYGRYEAGSATVSGSFILGGTSPVTFTATGGLAAMSQRPLVINTPIPHQIVIDETANAATIAAITAAEINLLSALTPNPPITVVGSSDGARLGMRDGFSVDFSGISHFNEEQTVQVVGATGGTFDLTFSITTGGLPRTITVANIPYDATTLEVQDLVDEAFREVRNPVTGALTSGLSSYLRGDLRVGGDLNSGLTFFFDGTSVAGRNQANIVVNNLTDGALQPLMTGVQGGAELIVHERASGTGGPAGLSREGENDPTAPFALRPDVIFPIDVDWTAAQLAAGIANGIILQPPPAPQIPVFGLLQLLPSISPQAIGNTISFSDGAFAVSPVTTAPALPPNNVLYTHPFTGVSAGSGGIVTGLAIQPNGERMFAVDDQGGFYEVENYRGAGTAFSTFLGTITDPVSGAPINFQGLTVGPQSVENGAYSDLLFGISDTGVLYAFDTAGVLQPLFLNGSLRAQINVPAGGPINGLDFSTLDTNLWHATPAMPTVRGATEMDVRLGLAAFVGQTIVVNEQQGNAGHGGGSSFHFGQGNVGGSPRSYDFPGGAHGVLESETFSLKGYSAADQPVLYFNYFLERGVTTFGDSIRVYASTTNVNHASGGAWVEIASDTGGGGQELFDYNTNILDIDQFWRQARIPLDQFAGEEEIRLRFDFSTAGDINLGDDSFDEILTTGTELRAPAGADLRDAEVFTISELVNGFNPIDFEIDLGYTLIAPGGVDIDDGDQFTIDGVTFEFDDGTGPPVAGGVIPLLYNDNFSARQIAQTIVSGINISSLNGVVIPHLFDNRINLQGAANVPLPISLPANFVEGAPGLATGFTLVAPDGASLADGSLFSINGTFFEFDDGSGPPAFGIAVPYNVNSTAEDVAQSIVSAILGSGLAGTVTPQLVGDRINLAGATSVLASPALPLTFIEGGLGASSDFTIALNAGMTSDEVAAVIADAVEFAFSFLGPPTSPPAVPIGEGLTVNTTNDVIANAFDTGLVGAAIGTYRFTGTIGDNPFTPPLLEADADVDLVRLDLNAGITIDVGAVALSGGLNPYIRVFDNAGNELAADDDGGPGPGFDSLLSFTTQFAGTYYIGVSSAPNTSYLADVQGSGDGESTGDYELSIGFGQRVYTASKLYNDVIQLIGHLAVDPGPLIFRDVLPGDGPTRPFNTDAFNNAQRGQDNVAEGFYIDDIIIGFAERGEAVSGALVNSNTYLHPSAPPVGEITSGNYTVEIRRGPDSAITQSSDTNDRYVQNVTFLAPPGHELVDGGTFRVGDGIHEVLFEFNDVTLGPGHTDFGITDGRIEIPFRPSDPDYVIAARIRDAINSTAVQNVIDVTAALGDGEVVTPAAPATPSTSNRVNLFGIAVTDVRTLEIVEAVSPLNADLLVETLIGASPEITYVPGSSLLFSVGDAAGIFTGGKSVIGIADGIILTSGDIFTAEGPNGSDATSVTASNESDIAAAALGAFPLATLDNEFGVVTADTTSLEFQFNLSVAGDISFDFVFASEEYNEFVNSTFNDAFAFFVDGVNIAFVPTTTTPVSVNNVNGGNPFGVLASNPGYYNNNDPSDGGQFLSQIGYDGFTSVIRAEAVGLAAGTHTIRLTISDVADTALDSAVFLSANSFQFNAALEGKPTGIPGLRFDEKGDQNRFRDQGQVIISSTSVTDSEGVGIALDAGQRSRPDLVPLAGALPHQGSVINPAIQNLERWAPGVVVVNSIIARNGAGGIRISGDPNITGDMLAAVSFARLINNTIYGLDNGDVGIDISVNSSPTLLNNIVANFTTGIQVDATSQSTIVQGTAYHRNGTNASGIAGGGGLGDFFLTLDPNEPLFVNADGGNFIPDAGSRVIDSSVAKVDERDERLGQLSLMGLGVSPLLAPELDASGQVRTDDPDANPPSGSGFDPFKDRGAIDRADFIGPTAVLRVPADNDPSVDLDPVENQVNVGFSIPVPYFAIQLVDGVDPNNPLDGSGIEDASVVTSRVKVFRLNENGQQLLIDGSDYKFTYDATNNVIRLTSTAGLWAPGAYVVLLDNSLDQKTINAPNGSLIVNGETIVVTDLQSNIATLEFVSGLSLTVPPALVFPTETFTISDGVTTHTFEFTNTGFFTPGNIPVDITVAPTQDIIAAAIVNAINTTTLAGLTPVTLGGGVVHLGGGPSHSVTTTSGLIISGNTSPFTPGAIPIPYIPSSLFSAQQSAAAIAAALQSSGLVNVPVTVNGSQVLLLNVASIVSNGRDGNLLAISDRTGNELLPNKSDDTTSFSIVLGIPDSDLGDAPDPYPTQISEGGAYHAVAGVDPLRLGALIDIEPNGAAPPDTDNTIGLVDEDGVTTAGLFSTGTATFTFQSSGPGKVDGWIDYNQNGVWETSEQVFISRDVVAGANPFQIVVPAVAPDGYWARFRLSTDGGLAPTGGAADGEVEDYLLQIGPPSPFQNNEPGRAHTDVNNDGFVNFADILVLISDLRTYGFHGVPGPLPGPQSPPPYLDPNGDNMVNFLDVLEVLSYIRNGGSPEGEAASQAEGESSSMLMSTTTDVTAATEVQPIEPSATAPPVTTPTTFTAPTTIETASSATTPSPTPYVSATPVTTPTRTTVSRAATTSSDSTLRSSSNVLRSSAPTAFDLQSLFAANSFDASAGFDSLGDDTSGDAEANYVLPDVGVRLDDEDDLLDDSDLWDDEFESALDEIADEVNDGWNSEEAVDSIFGDLETEFVGRGDGEE
ncbi:MAG: choice-of-anchor L domain-containing protein [Pirellulaceae bacterium]